MIARLIHLWDARTPRERLLLTIMAAALAGVAVWLLVVRPVGLWAERAAQRRLEAASALTAVRAARPGASARPANLEATLQATASAHGLEPVVGMSEEGGLGFRLNTADGDKVLRWLADIKAATGAEPTRLSMLAEDGRLTVDGAY